MAGVSFAPIVTQGGSRLSYVRYATTVNATAPCPIQIGRISDELEKRLLDLPSFFEVTHYDDGSHDAATKEKTFDASQNDLRQVAEV